MTAGGEPLDSAGAEVSALVAVVWRSDGTMVDVISDTGRARERGWRN